MLAEPSDSAMRPRGYYSECVQEPPSDRKAIVTSGDLDVGERWSDLEERHVTEILTSEDSPCKSPLQSGSGWLWRSQGQSKVDFRGPVSLPNDTVVEYGQVFVWNRRYTMCVAIVHSR